LFKDSLAVGKTDGELGFEVWDLVVDCGVLGDEAGFVELDKGGFGSEVDHGVGVGHAGETRSFKFP